MEGAELKQTLVKEAPMQEKQFLKSETRKEL